jgi:hypothetical protein
MANEYDDSQSSDASEQAGFDLSQEEIRQNAEVARQAEARRLDDQLSSMRQMTFNVGEKTTFVPGLGGGAVNLSKYKDGDFVGSVVSGQQFKVVDNGRAAIAVTKASMTEREARLSASKQREMFSKPQSSAITEAKTEVAVLIETPQREQDMKSTLDYAERVRSGEIQLDEGIDAQRFWESIEDVQRKYDILQRAKSVESSYQVVPEDVKSQLDVMKSVALSPASSFVEVTESGITIKNILDAEKAGVPLSEFEKLGFSKEDIEKQKDFEQKLTSLPSEIREAYRTGGIKGYERAYQEYVTSQEDSKRQSQNIVSTIAESKNVQIGTPNKLSDKELDSLLLNGVSADILVKAGNPYENVVESVKRVNSQLEQKQNEQLADMQNTYSRQLKTFYKLQPYAIDSEAGIIKNKQGEPVGMITMADGRPSLEPYRFTQLALAQYLFAHPKDLESLREIGFQEESLNQANLIASQASKALSDIDRQIKQYSTFQERLPFDTANALSSAGLVGTELNLPKVWDKASESVKRDVAIDYVTNPYNKNEFAASVQYVMRTTEGNLPAQLLPTTILVSYVGDPIARTTVKLPVAPQEWALAGATVVITGLSFGGSGALAGLGTAGRLASAGLWAGSGAVFSKQTVDDIRDGKLKGAYIPLAIGMDALIFAGAAGSLKGVRVGNPSRRQLIAEVAEKIDRNSQLAEVDAALAKVQSNLKTAPPMARFVAGSEMAIDSTIQFVKDVPLRVRIAVNDFNYAVNQLSDAVKATPGVVTKVVTEASDAVKIAYKNLQDAVASVPQIITENLKETGTRLQVAANDVKTYGKMASQIAVNDAVYAVDSLVSIVKATPDWARAEVQLSMREARIALSRAEYAIRDFPPEVSRAIRKAIETAKEYVRNIQAISQSVGKIALNEVEYRFNQVVDIAKASPKEILNRIQDLRESISDVATSIKLSGKMASQVVVNDILYALDRVEAAIKASPEVVSGAAKRALETIREKKQSIVELAKSLPPAIAERSKVVVERLGESLREARLITRDAMQVAFNDVAYWIDRVQTIASDLPSYSLEKLLEAISELDNARTRARIAIQNLPDDIKQVYSNMLDRVEILSNEVGDAVKTGAAITSDSVKVAFNEIGYRLSQFDDAVRASIRELPNKVDDLVQTSKVRLEKLPSDVQVWADDYISKLNDDIQTAKNEQNWKSEIDDVRVKIRKGNREALEEARAKLTEIQNRLIERPASKLALDELNSTIKLLDESYAGEETWRQSIRPEIEAILTDIQEALDKRNAVDLVNAGKRLSDLAKRVKDKTLREQIQFNAENIQKNASAYTSIDRYIPKEDVEKFVKGVEQTEKTAKSLKDIYSESRSLTPEDILVEADTTGKIYGTRPYKAFEVEPKEGTISTRPISPEEISLIQSVNRDNVLLSQLRNEGGTQYDIGQVISRIRENMDKLAKLRNEKIPDLPESLNKRLRELGYKDEAIEKLSDYEKLKIVAENIPPEEGLGGTPAELPKEPKGGGGTGIREKTETTTKPMTSSEIERLMREKETPKETTKESTEKPKNLYDGEFIGAVEAPPKPEVKPEFPPEPTVEPETPEEPGKLPRKWPMYPSIEPEPWEKPLIPPMPSPERPVEPEKIGEPEKETPKTPLPGKAPEKSPEKEPERREEPATPPLPSREPFREPEPIREPERQPEPSREPFREPFREPKPTPEPFMEPEPIREPFKEPYPEPYPTPEPTPEPEPYPEMARPVETPTKTKIPPFIPFGSLPAEVIDKAGKLKAGIIEWRQGIKWAVLPPREDGTYNNEDILYLDKPLPGTYKFAMGKGSAYKTLQVIGGAPKKDAVVDMGWAVVNIKAKELTMTFVGGQEAANDRWAEEKSLDDFDKASYAEPQEATMRIPKGTKRTFPVQGLEKTLLPQYSKEGVKVYLINGQYARDNLNTDFTMGGHSKVYPKFIPHGEVWIDNDLDDVDRRATIVHELVEYRKMVKDRLPYLRAHSDYANVAESEARDNPEMIETMIEKELKHTPKVYNVPNKKAEAKKEEGARYYLGHKLRPVDLGISL